MSVTSFRVLTASLGVRAHQSAVALRRKTANGARPPILTAFPSVSERRSPDSGGSGTSGPQVPARRHAAHLDGTRSLVHVEEAPLVTLHSQIAGSQPGGGRSEFDDLVYLM